jgi:hypothetical protein
VIASRLLGTVVPLPEAAVVVKGCFDRARVLALALALVLPSRAMAWAALSLEGGVKVFSHSRFGASEGMPALGIRFASANPKPIRPDIALLITDGAAVDIDLATSVPIGGQPLLELRAGGSASRHGFGSGYFRGWNVGAGLLTRVAPSLGFRLDVSERILYFSLEGDELSGDPSRVLSATVGLAWMGHAANGR